MDEIVEAAAKATDNLKPSYSELGSKAPCFLAGTLINIFGGYKPIEKIENGDNVLSYNFETHKVEIKRVINVFQNWTDNYFEIKTSKNIIVATSKHLFWLENEKKWFPSKELKIGDELRSVDLGVEHIKAINRIRKEHVTTYNFEVEELHNYFVGELGVLVHNKNKPSLFESTMANNVDFYKVVDAKGKIDRDDDFWINRAEINVFEQLSEEYKVFLNLTLKLTSEVETKIAQ